MKILVGMSGGVDSAYAALKLMGEGHTVEGAVLLMHGYTEIDSARQTANNLGIKLYEIDAREKFSQTVIPNFISEYMAARTPNPCIVCNSDVKFRVLKDFAMENGFDMIATGHYARIKEIPNPAGTRFAIAEGQDCKKDQSYMLWRLPQDILSVTMFPLSETEKEDTRRAAAEASLSVADKAESQEICFIPDGDYATYIENRVGICPPGDFVDESGNKLGRHNGIIRYTVGQRKGLGIALGVRSFVSKIDPVANTVTLTPSLTEREELVVGGVVLSGVASVSEKPIYRVRLRYQAKPLLCSVTDLGDGRVKVILKEKARVITAGQSAVFYDGDTVAFGGFIE